MEDFIYAGFCFSHRAFCLLLRVLQSKRNPDETGAGGAPNAILDLAEKHSFSSARFVWIPFTL
jgi:hypothetical protein